MGVVFIDSFRHVLSNSEETRRASMLEFALTVALKEKPYMLVTPSGLASLAAQVWSVEDCRDFLLQLSFVFFSRLGESDDFVLGLSRNLARGCSYVDTVVKQDYTAIPEVVGDRLADNVSALNIINANRWLMIVLLLQAFFDQKMLADATDSHASPKK